MRRSEIPIILTAFGTTDKAFSTYKKMDTTFRTVFPNNPIHWAFSPLVTPGTLENALNELL